VWVTVDKEGGWLTLTTCNPKYSARERLIVSAELVSGPNLAYIEYLSRI
jgi:sortase (surface protein transpeptidase)